MKKIMQVTAVSSLFALALAQQETADAAFVRVAHLSPNAPAVSVDIGGGGGFFAGDGTTVTDAEALSDIEYRDVTEYVAVAGGDYDVVVTAEGGSFQENVNFAAGGYYTIAALGLIAPGGLDQTETPDDGGFLGFGGTGDTLGFRLEVLEEDITPLTAAQQPAAAPAAGDPAATGTAADPAAQPADPATQPADPAAQPADPAAGPTVADPALTQLVSTRLMHAAPGVAQVSLVSVGATAGDAAAGDAATGDAAAGDAAAGDAATGAATTDDANVLINNVPFGDISEYNDLDPAQLAALQLRIEDSPAASLSLEDTTLEPNTIYTMFVIGTPLEEGPLEVLLVGTTLGGQQQEADQQEDAQQQAVPVVPVDPEDVEEGDAVTGGQEALPVVPVDPEAVEGEDDQDQQEQQEDQQDQQDEQQEGQQDEQQDDQNQDN